MAVYRASDLLKDEDEQNINTVQGALETVDTDVATQTEQAFGEIAGYQEAPEYGSKEAYREATETDELDGLMEAYRQSGEDYYSEEELMAMPENERFAILSEERDRLRKEAIITDYVASEDGGVSKEKHDEAYLRSLDFQTLTDILYNEDRDLVNKYTADSGKNNEFILDAVPKAIAPFVRVTAKGNGFVVVKPLAEIEDASMENIEEQLRFIQSEKVSDGAALSSYEPTAREKTHATVAGILKSVGYGDGDGRAAMRYAQQIVGTRDRIGMADFFLVGSGFGAQEAARDISRLNRDEDATAGDYVAPGLTLGLSAIEAVPYVGIAAKYGKKLLRAGSNATDASRVANEAADEIDSVVDTAVKNDNIRKQRANAKLNIGRAKAATEDVKQEQRAAAISLASKNDEIAEDLIRAYDRENMPEGQTIGKKVKVKLDDGTEVERTVIDYEKARNVSVTRLNDIDLPDGVLDANGFGPDGYRNPILNPDTYDAVIAMVAETKKLHPEAFDGAEDTIEGLFNALVERNLVMDENYIEMMAKYGLSMDDLVKTAVGSVRKGAQVMNKHKQLKRIMDGRELTPAEKAQKELDDAYKNFGILGSAFRRLENSTRGLVVSAFATAARNFQTTLVQFPIEGLTSVIDTALTSVAKGKSVKNVYVDSRKTFSNTFKMYGRMFSDPLEMKDYVQFIYRNGGEEGRKMLSTFYDQISEIQKATGRGVPRERQIARLMKMHKMSKKEATKIADDISSGTITDKVGKVTDFALSEVEDMVSVLNAPNRFQEHISRHTFMLQKIEQLVDKEYGVDFFELVNNGKIGQLWGDTLPNKPKGARTFAELMAEATDYGVRRTFAAPPKSKFFNVALDILNRPVEGSLPKRLTLETAKFTGRTILLFPRFLFTSLEYMGSLTPYELIKFTGRVGGRGTKRAIQETKQMLGRETGEKARLIDLDEDDTESIARSMAGTLVFTAAYQAAKAGEVITRDGMIELPFTDAKLDPKAMYPVAQIAYVAKAAQIWSEEGAAQFNNWFRTAEFVELFSGANIGKNTGLGDFVDGMIAMFSEEAKIGSTEKMAQNVGELVGNVATRPLQPFQMWFDAQRMGGVKSKTLLNFAEDPDMTIGGAFRKGFSLKMKERGFVSREEELAADPKNYPLSPDGKTYNYPGYKMALGLSILDGYPLHKDFFLQYDLRDFDFQSKTGIKTVDNFTNGILKDIMPSVGASMAVYEMTLRRQGLDDTQVYRRVRERTMQVSRNVKSLLAEKATRAIGADNVPKVQALLALRSINANQQKIAIEEFFKVANRPPDMSNARDLSFILKIAKDQGFTENLLK